MYSHRYIACSESSIIKAKCKEFFYLKNSAKTSEIVSENKKAKKNARNFRSMKTRERRRQRHWTIANPTNAKPLSPTPLISSGNCDHYRRWWIFQNGEGRDREKNNYKKLSKSYTHAEALIVETRYRKILISNSWKIFWKRVETATVAKKKRFQFAKGGEREIRATINRMASTRSESITKITKNFLSRKVLLYYYLRQSSNIANGQSYVDRNWGIPWEIGEEDSKFLIARRVNSSVIRSFNFQLRGSLLTTAKINAAAVIYKKKKKKKKQCR